MLDYRLEFNVECGCKSSGLRLMMYGLRELCVRLGCKSCLALDIKFEIIDGHGCGCDDFLVNDTSYMEVIYRLEQCMQVPKFI